MPGRLHGGVAGGALVQAARAGDGRGSCAARPRSSARSPTSLPCPLPPPAYLSFGVLICLSRCVCGYMEVAACLSLSFSVSFAYKIMLVRLELKPPILDPPVRAGSAACAASAVLHGLCATAGDGLRRADGL